jgi:hypothetical protein
MFEDERLEREFNVRGGLLWFHHVLIAAIEIDKSYSVSRRPEDGDLGLISSRSDYTPETSIWQTAPSSILNHCPHLY